MQLIFETARFTPPLDGRGLILDSLRSELIARGEYGMVLFVTTFNGALRFGGDGRAGKVLRGYEMRLFPLESALKAGVLHK